MFGVSTACRFAEPASTCIAGFLLVQIHQHNVALLSLGLLRFALRLLLSSTAAWLVVPLCLFSARCLVSVRTAPPLSLLMRLGWLVHRTESSSMSLWQSLRRWRWLCRLAGPQTWLCYAASLRGLRVLRLSRVHFLHCLGAIV